VHYREVLVVEVSRRDEKLDEIRQDSVGPDFDGEVGLYRGLEALKLCWQAA